MDKVKVLFLAPCPDASRLQLDEEIRAIEQKIWMAEYREAIDFIPVVAVRPDDLLLAFQV